MTESPVSSRRAFLRLLGWSGMAGATLALPACAEAPLRSPRPQARPGLAGLPAAQPATDIVNRARLGGTVGFAVIDMDSGRLLEDQNAQAALPPASVAKAVTALYTREALGPSHRFTTRLMGTGAVSEGTLQGDLWLVGGGDPTLDTDALAAMAAALRARGVQRITGRFRVWGSALPHIAQITDDQPPQAGYNATVSGLNLNFNRVHFSWRRSGGGHAVAMDARSGTRQPAVSMAQMQIVNRRTPVYTYTNRDGLEQWTVAQPALGGSGARWLPVRQPERYAADVFRTLAAAQGVTLPAGEPAPRTATPGGTVLAEHRSDPLDTLLRDMLRFSTNITAEAMGLAASIARGHAPGNLRASAQLMNGWAAQRYGLRTAGFTDHSGLGADAAVGMADLARFFARSGAEGALPELLRAHDMRDASGNRIANHPLRVRAKTGTLHFVSALGGVVTAPGDRRLAFAISAADLPRRARIPEAQRERPEGGAAWTRRARRMQQELIERWGAVHG